MGFYGNITNNAKTQFQFDRIYSNRYLMDSKINADDVYIGRYVLVEYDKGGYSKDDFTIGYVDKDGLICSDVNRSVKFNKSEIPLGTMFIVPDKETATTLEEIYNSLHYIYTAKEYIGNYVKVSKISSSTDTEYTKNYNIDTTYYGQGRGYDSTVWQRVYVENTEKYVMIAELNSVVPTFDIVSDAPTLIPTAPHFDANSTDVYYKLHWQTPWGFRIAEDTQGIGSDEKVNHIIVDQQTYAQQEKSVNGKIYYNKAGFDSYQSNHSDPNIHKNYISITPTGMSGQRYYNHSNAAGVLSQQIDTQELAISLPAIGDAVADFWDVMYGKTRNHDISWDSYAGIRLVGENNSYDIDSVATVAGAINSVHDLMGMIIESDEDLLNKDNINSASLSKIYHCGANDRYYRKAIDYMYENAEVEYVQVDVEPATYANGLYYTEKDGVYEAATGYEENVVYYEKRLSKNNRGTYFEAPVLVDYEPGQYYIFNISDYLLASESQFELGRSHFKVFLTNDTKENVIPYEQYTYYREDEGKWVSDEQYVEGDFKYYTIQSNKNNTLYAYAPNQWYYLKDVGEAEPMPVPDENPYITEGREYYLWRLNDEGNPVIYETPVHVVEYNPDIHYIYDKENKIYNPAPENILSNCRNIQFCEITTTPVSEDKKFYVKNTYYFEDENRNVLLDTSDVYTKDREYHIPAVEQVYFYRPEYYYYQLNEEYVLDMNDKLTAGRVYYEKNPYYIIEDTSRTFEVGAPWNANVERIPCAITLGMRTSYYKWVELEGFARDLNTIHGLILRINQIAEFGDKQTRDLETIQGCINTINDIVDKVNDLVPGQFVITNAYGQLSPADWTTDSWLQVKVNEETDNIDFQHIGPVGEGTETNFTISAVNDEISSIKFQTLGYDDRGHIFGLTEENIGVSTDEWIQVDGDTEEHSHTITIKHTGPVGAAADFNAGQTIFSISKDNDVDALITLQALSYDDKGHINEQVDENILISTDDWLQVIGNTDEEEDERVHSLQFIHTGPMEEKEKTTFAIVSNDDEVASIGFETLSYDEKGHINKQTANTISVSTDNWIQVNGSSLENAHTLSFNHEQPNKTDTIEKEEKSPKFGENFDIPLLSWDGKGHIYADSNNVRNITLPKPSLNDFTATDSSVLTGISMVAETGAITQTNANVGTLKLTDYIEVKDDEGKPDISPIKATDSINTAFGKIQNQIDTNATNILQEETRAKLAEQTNATNIANEVTRASEQEGLLNNRIQNIENDYITSETKFEYLEANEEQDVPAVEYTVSQLMKKVAELENIIRQLELKIFIEDESNLE